MEFSIWPQVIILCGLTFFVTFVWKIFSIHARSNKSDNAPPEPAGAWPIIGHLHLLGGNKLLHHVFGEMADKYGPVFLLQLGVHKTVVVNSWEVAKECFTVQDKVFASHPKSFALEFMGYDQGMLGFLPYGENWRDLRKLVMVEMLCNSRLEKLKHVPESEVNFFIKGLYDLWISKGAGNSMPVVELKERFGDLTMNIVVRMVVGKHYFSTGEESRRFQKALENFMYLMGSIMVSDAFPLFGWIDSLTGYKAKMKKTAKDLDQILDRWMKEHREERKLSSINELQQDFMHVMLTVMDSDPSAQISDTSIKGTCLKHVKEYISAGTRLFVNLSKLQRDPSIWSNPLEFQPERFLEKHVDIDMFGKNFELIPFGSGRRACPGIPLALQVLHLTLARFLHGFELGTVSDLPIDMTESAGLSNPKATPLEVTFRPRLVASLYV